MPSSSSVAGIPGHRRSPESVRSRMSWVRDQGPDDPILDRSGEFADRRALSSGSRRSATRSRDRGRSRGASRWRVPTPRSTRAGRAPARRPAPRPSRGRRAGAPSTRARCPPLQRDRSGGEKRAPLRPTAARMRPQFGSPPCSAVFTSGEVATACAASFASRSRLAPLDLDLHDARRPFAVAHDHPGELAADLLSARSRTPRASAPRLHRRSAELRRRPAGARCRWSRCRRRRRSR